MAQHHCDHVHTNKYMSTTDLKKKKSNYNQNAHARASDGGNKTFINALRSSATVSHLWLGRVSTPPAARARSSSLDICDKARRSHSTPCETASTWSSSNLAADPTSRSSTYSIQHSATTKKNTHPITSHHVTNIQLRSKIQVWLKPIFDAPNLRWGRQDFHQRAAQLCYSEPLVVGSSCLHTTHSSQGAKLISWYFRHIARRSHSTPCETAPTRSSSTLAANSTSYGPTACNTPQPQNSTHPTTLNQVTNIQLSS